MEFTISTKPLATALDLAVVSNNVSKFFRKSCLAQLNVRGNELSINLEAAFISSELKFKGSPDSDFTATVFLDCLLLKQLVSTFESSTVSIEFTDGGVILKSGKSRFTLPKMLDASEIELARPEFDKFDTRTSINVDKTGWKFVKDNQMYSIAMSYAYPVYTKVWVSQEGDVLVGDLNSSLFTYSRKSNLGTTCLLSDTIINLFNSLPEGAKIVKGDRSYMILVSTDGFEYAAQFRPQYEDDPDVGSYSSKDILESLAHSEFNIQVNPAAVTKVLNQALLLSSSTEDVVSLTIQSDKLVIADSNVSATLDVKSSGMNFPETTIKFKTSSLQSVIKTYVDDSVCIGLAFNDGEVVGIVIWSKELTTVLAGVD